MVLNTREVVPLCFSFFSELCWGKALGGLYNASTKEERRKQKTKRRERDQIKFIDLGFERWQVVRFRNARGREDVSVRAHGARVIVSNPAWFMTEAP